MGAEHPIVWEVDGKVRIRSELFEYLHRWLTEDEASALVWGMSKKRLIALGHIVWAVLYTPDIFAKLGGPLHVHTLRGA